MEQMLPSGSQTPPSRPEKKTSEPSRLWCFVVDALEWKRSGNTCGHDFLKSQVRGHWVSSRRQPAGGAVDWNSLLWEKAKKFVWVNLSSLWSILRWEQRSRDVDCCKAVVQQPSVIPGRLEKQGENLNVWHLQLKCKPLKGLWRDAHSILDKVEEWSFWLGMVAQVCDLRPWKGREERIAYLRPD